MTKDQAEILILKDLLEQSTNTIKFLNNCLDSSHSAVYLYPHQTQIILDEIAEYVSSRPTCYHSHFMKDCDSCITYKKYLKVLNKAKIIYEDSKYA